jgi:hypothetical protein
MKNELPFRIASSIGPLGSAPAPAADTMQYGNFGAYAMLPTQMSRFR